MCPLACVLQHDYCPRSLPPYPAPAGQPARHGLQGLPHRRLPAAPRPPRLPPLPRRRHCPAGLPPARRKWASQRTPSMEHAILLRPSAHTQPACMSGFLSQFLAGTPTAPAAPQCTCRAEGASMGTPTLAMPAGLRSEPPNPQCAGECTGTPTHWDTSLHAGRGVSASLSSWLEHPTTPRSQPRLNLLRSPSADCSQENTPLSGHKSIGPRPQSVPASNAAENCRGKHRG